MRDSAGIAAIFIAAVVVVAAPVTFAVQASWRPELTIALVIGAVLCAVLVCSAPVVMAWRGTWPGRQRDTDTIKLIDGSLKLAQRALPMAAAQDAARPWWDTMPEPEYVDTTAMREGRD